MKVSKALQNIRDNGEFLSLFNQGMSFLYRSGVFDFLRENGRIFPVSPEVPNYVDYQAAIANWSVGYNTAIDHLLNFRETFLEAPTDVSDIQADFGALDRAVINGDLTKEEADAIRSGKSIPVPNAITTGGGSNTKA